MNKLASIRLVYPHTKNYIYWNLQNMQYKTPLPVLSYAELLWQMQKYVMLPWRYNFRRFKLI